LSKPRNLDLIASSVFITLVSAVAAYYRAFSSLALYDDEGTMMMTVKRFFEGNALYDQVASVYGPLYYFYEWSAHTLARIPLSHDSVRLVSITFWVGAALMVFLLVYRATGSLLLGALMHILAFRAMRFIGDEPAHPQEACIFLLMAFGLACYTANRTWRMAWLGALAGAMLATKINLGIFAVLALAAGFAYAMRPGAIRTAAVFAASAGALVFPVLLIWGYREEWWAVRLCAVVVISLAAVILTISHIEWDIHIRIRDMVVAGLSCAAAIAAICSFPLAHGSTIQGMVEWLIVKPRTIFGHVWFLPAPVDPVAPLWAVSGLIFAWYVATKRLSSSVIEKAKLVFGTAVILLCTASLYSDLINFATPFIWLVAVRPEKSAPGSQDSFARAVLALAGVIQVLYVYPVAGSQIQFAAIFLIALAGVCLWDGIPLRVSSAIPVAALAVMGACYLGLAWRVHAYYETLEPLGLPGAERLHLEPEMAAAVRAIAGQVNASACTMLVTEPSLFSFNFWTHVPAPDGLPGAWVIFLSDAEEERIVQQVARDPHACVIRRQDIVDQWTRHGDVSSQPLVRYIRENFRTVYETYGYCFMVRKPGVSALQLNTSF